MLDFPFLNKQKIAIFFYNKSKAQMVLPFLKTNIDKDFFKTA